MMQQNQIQSDSIVIKHWLMSDELLWILHKLSSIISLSFDLLICFIAWLKYGVIRDLSRGKVMVINYASWVYCDSCELRIPAVAEL